MNILEYDQLPENLKHHLHALEIREAYHAIFRITRSQTGAKRAIHEQVFGSEFHVWRDQVEEFINMRRSPKQRKRELVIYYLIAGCGINQICKLLKVGQARVYKVRDSIPTFDQVSHISGALSSDKEAINNLQYLLEDLTIMDGFRVAKPERARHNPFIDLYKTEDED